MAKPVTLTPGMQVVAFKLQEAAALMHGDVRKRLDDAVQDAHRASGSYGYYVDHNGDGESGDVIYSSGGDLKAAPYEIGNLGGKAVANIDMDNARDVVPMTIYQDECDDDDQYSTMQEAGLYTKGPIPLCERFISKKERDAASEDDFAGKGKSFPILQPGDIMAAVHSMGRAGSENVGSSTIKSRIIAIAKRKGWTKYLPKAWQEGGDQKEAAKTAVGGLRLTESASTLEAIVLKEAKADYEIKLIAPGKGSSAFYPAEVLKRDGPKVFSAGTHVYLNHPTSAEEAARPEGDVKNLAGVLTTSAVYHESHAKGPGLYARMKVFADHAQVVEEKAPHVGMSIRASGVAESSKSKDGLPVLKELVHAESVDVVTRAGAGGMILTEAAKPANKTEEVEMTEAEAKRLVESAVAAAMQPIAALEARALRGDAMILANGILADLALPDAAKAKVIERVTTPGILPVHEGKVDEKKLGELVVLEVKKEADYLIALNPDYGRVLGFGPSGPSGEKKTPAELREEARFAKEQATELQESEAAIFASLMGNSVAGKHAAMKGVA